MKNNFRSRKNVTVLVMLSLMISTVVLSGSGVDAKAAQITSYTLTPTGFLEKLVVVNEESRTGYNRSSFKHWIDYDKDGCDTRREVIYQEARIKPLTCKENKGKWYSIYDGVMVYNASDLEVDHVVSLAEAWDSGANGWGYARREAFANDLSNQFGLVAVTSDANRAKSDSDASEWKSDKDAGRCFFAIGSIVTKWRWQLSIDSKEEIALREQLKSCSSKSIKVSQVSDLLKTEISSNNSDYTMKRPTTQTPSPVASPTESGKPNSVPSQRPSPNASESSTPANTPITKAPAASPSPITKPATPSPVPSSTKSPSPAPSPNGTIPTTVTPPTDAKPNSDGSCPNSHPVKGVGKLKLYYLRAFTNYSSIQADACFLNEMTAIKFEFKPAKA